MAITIKIYYILFYSKGLMLLVLIITWVLLTCIKDNGGRGMTHFSSRKMIFRLQIHHLVSFCLCDAGSPPQLKDKINKRNKRGSAWERIANHQLVTVSRCHVSNTNWNWRRRRSSNCAATGWPEKLSDWNEANSAKLWKKSSQVWHLYSETW